MQVPSGWSIVGIEETLRPFENGQTLRQGWSPQCEKFPAGTDADWGVLKTTAIQDGEFQPEHNKQLPSALEPDPLLEVEVGDLILTCAGPRSRCGVICLVRKTRPKLMISGKMYRFRTDERVAIGSYLEAFLRAHDTKKRIDELKTGISDSGLNLTLARFKTLKVPLPPLNEQRRIVAKIEELFSELDKGIENLKQARAQLAVYRQALLKHAFEGKLTVAWRAERANLLKSPAELSEELNFAREQRVGPAKTNKTEAELVRSELPPIPDEWAWARLDAIGLVGSGMSVSKDRELDEPIEVPYLRVANVQRGRLDLSVMKMMKIEARDLEGLKLRNGDVLFNEGGDRDKLGRGWVWDGQIDPCITQNHVFRVTPISLDCIAPKFLSHWGNTFGQEFFLDHGKQTTNLASINKAALSRLPVPVPTIAEQHEIVLRIDEQLSVLDALSWDINENLQKAEALRQSILKKAFAGELVPQDPNDEPASVLLARIRDERVSASIPQKKPRQRRMPCPAA
jgi:type I restriction enzyme S subunit